MLARSFQIGTFLSNNQAMQYKQQEPIISALINEDLSLRQCWSQPAEVTHIPFMGTRSHFFLLINILVTPDLIDRGLLLNTCLSVVRKVVESSMLIDEKAVEVAIYTSSQSRAQRVVRLSVMAHAFAQIANLQATDLMGNHLEGIACHWPL